MNEFFSNLSDIFGRLGALFTSYKPIIDTIDIILVAILIFEVVKFLRESRALHVVKGIILLLVVYFVINLLGMQASTYIFRLLMNNFFIIVIILFAPEFRHALESVGRSRFSFLRIFGINQSEKEQMKSQKVLHEICKSCIDMSKKKIGAIIVIERDITVNDHVSMGTYVNGEVSAELLGSLFFPNSPLHDGAVIIRKNSVYAAGCILPLTQNNDLSSELGTRHRASLGLSEQCDAVVVVVSEERGQISIAHKGYLSRDISENELFEKLSKYFAPVDISKGKKISLKRGASDK